MSYKREYRHPELHRHLVALKGTIPEQPKVIDGCDVWETWIDAKCITSASFDIIKDYVASVGKATDNGAAYFGQFYSMTISHLYEVVRISVTDNMVWQFGGDA